MNADNIEIIDLTPDNIANYGVCGYKDLNKHLELRKKIDWFKEYYNKGLRIKAVISKEGEYQGMLEYIPGEYAHRPVNAENYMFIHCIFVGFKNEFKGKGFATSLINECIKDAKSEKMNGVSVVTRKGSFMAKKDIFLKLGFIQVDESDPDFELMVLKFNDKLPNPSFKDMSLQLKKYKIGLTILRSSQCPYSEKNVNEIVKTASEKYNIKAKVINIESAKEAQNSPCAFGTFCIIYNGEIISYSPISNTRFENIMKDKIKTDK